MKEIKCILGVMAVLGTLFMFLSVSWAAPKTTVNSASANTGPADFKAIQMASLQPILNNIGADDSYVVLSGKIDLGGADYFEAVPQMHTIAQGSWQCQDIVSYYIPQKKSAEAEGYKYVWIFKGTGSSPSCWKGFKEITEFQCVTQSYMLVKKTAASGFEYWDITSPYPVKHEYTLGPLQAK